MESRIAGDASDLARAPARVAASAPDVLLMEYLPGQESSGWGWVARAAHAPTPTRLLLLCQSYSEQGIVRFIQRGVSGCLLASSAPALYAKAVLAVHAGESWYPRSELLQALRSQLPPDSVAAWEMLNDEALLTAREREILELVGKAMSNKEIARALRISDKTVKTHLHHIYVKLHRSGRYKAFVSSVVLPPTPRPSSLGKGRHHGAED